MKLPKKGLVTSMLFPTPNATYNIDSFPGELIWVPFTPPDSGLRGCSSVPCLLLLYESARFLILFFHSNAEDLGRCRWFCLFLREQFQCHILAVEYPGYGVCSGTATRESILANAHAALEFATESLRLPLEQIKIFGRSIGTGPALHLASKYKVAGLVLVTPFLSIRQLFKDKVGPLSKLVEEWFPNDEAMQAVDSPTLIIHGREDKIIPYLHGEELYKLCQSRKLFISPKNMDHNTNLTSNVSYLILPMFRFFSLPDYSFKELKVPSWAFEKRHSPFFQRPAVEVCSQRAVPGGLLHCNSALNIPEGDEEEEELDQNQVPARLRVPVDVHGRMLGALGDTPVDDSEVNAVLSNPLVLHSFRATRDSYDFNGGGLVPDRLDLIEDGMDWENTRPLDWENSATSSTMPGNFGDGL